ncbi:ALMS1 protein, partial [Grantiella picta]|nr:ALMS1 protein [Grantiella picta]
AALSSKRRTQMLDKGVQAGDLEIVSSATRRSTRDVGVTFPTPRCSQQLQESPEGWQGGHRGTVGTAGQTAAWHQHRAQQGRIPLEKRTKRSRLHFQQGTAWLIQAEDLRSESRKENQGKKDGPGPSWFEPWSSSKPWREPLREKNWEEQQPSRAQGAAAA